MWKNSRKQFGAPDCPKDLNEGQWASLLFGSRCEVCFPTLFCKIPDSIRDSQVCGTKGVPRADFYLRRRVCVRCKKAKYVTPLCPLFAYLKRYDSYIVRHKALSEFPDSEAILLLIPSTNGMDRSFVSCTPFLNLVSGRLVTRTCEL